MCVAGAFAITSTWQALRIAATAIAQQFSTRHYARAPSGKRTLFAANSLCFQWIFCVVFLSFTYFLWWHCCWRARLALNKFQLSYEHAQRAPPPPAPAHWCGTQMLFSAAAEAATNCCPYTHSHNQLVAYLPHPSFTTTFCFCAPSLALKCLPPFIVHFIFIFPPIYCNFSFFFLLKTCYSFFLAHNYGVTHVSLLLLLFISYFYLLLCLSSFAKYLFLCLQINNLLVHTVCSFVAIKSCRNSSHVTI